MQFLRQPPEATAPTSRSEPVEELRPLGAFENLFAAYAEKAVVTFTQMVELDGEITRSAIEQALESVQARHPLLAVGIRRGATGRRVFVRSARPIPLKELPNGAVPWELAAGLELRRRFEVEEGPLLQVSVRFEPKSVRLFFTFHHSIADGMSAVFVMRDFVRALSGDRLQPFQDAPSLDHWLAHLPRRKPFCPEEDAMGLPLPPESEVLMRWGRGMGAMPAVSSLALAADFTRRLRVVARFHDATVHAALSVALAQTMATLQDSTRQIRVMSPINQRGPLGADDRCGLLISGGITPVESGRTTFWDEARKAKAALELCRDGDALHGMIAAMAVFREIDDTAEGARQAFAAGFDFDMMLTNLGMLPFPARHGRIKIKAITGPIVLASVADEHVIGVATLEDRLQLTYTSISPLPDLLERAEKRLLEACAGW